MSSSSAPTPAPAPGLVSGLVRIYASTREEFLEKAFNMFKEAVDDLEYYTDAIAKMVPNPENIENSLNYAKDLIASATEIELNILHFRSENFAILTEDMSYNFSDLYTTAVNLKHIAKAFVEYWSKH